MFRAGLGFIYQTDGVACRHLNRIAAADYFLVLLSYC